MIIVCHHSASLIMSIGDPRGGFFYPTLLFIIWILIPGHIAQLVTCLATDATLTAYSEAVRSILARSHTFVEIDHEILSMVTLLPSAEAYMKGCCQ